MKFPLAALAAAVVLVITLSGCGARASAVSSPVTRNSAPSNSTAPTPTDNSTAQSQPTRALTAAAKVAAARTAETVIGLYARPNIDGQTWIEALDPYLTQDAAAAFAGTDPSTIPAHNLTGPASVLPASTAAGVLADVPTDVGAYRVFLLKSDTGWLTDQITPPRQG